MYTNSTYNIYKFVTIPMAQRQVMWLVEPSFAGIIFGVIVKASFSVSSVEFLAITYTYSRNALETLKSNLCSPSFISLLQLYNEFCNKGFHILICYFFAHVGMKGNEAADKAAKQVCNTLNSQVSYSNLKLAGNSLCKNGKENETGKLKMN